MESGAEPGGIPDEVLLATFGWPTLTRGREYAESGRVLEVRPVQREEGLALLTGVVAGSQERTYSTRVTIIDDREGAFVGGSCTCPMTRSCKHVAATALVALARGDGPGGGVAAWERRLAQVLDELDEAAEAAAGGSRPLALQVELAAPQRSRWAVTGDHGGARRGALRLRPLQEGARGGWVRSGVSWYDVQRLEQARGHDPAQVAVLGELLAAHRAANRQSYYGNEAHLSLATFGAGLWPLLAEAERAGLALVPAGALRAVRVEPAPVALRVDVAGADTPRAHLRLGVDHQGEWYAGDRVDVLGATGHGVALWTPTGTSSGTGASGSTTWEVVLAPLTRRAGPATRRLLAETGSLPVPREQVPELVAGYLPRLRRHLPVGSSDATVSVPEAPEPRLALTVTWKAVDEAHLAWTWRYRVGDGTGDDRVYALDDARGTRSLRRLDAERAVLERLGLDEEQRLRLCGTTRSGVDLIPVQTLRGEVVVAFVDDTLEPLEAAGRVEIEEIGSRPRFHAAEEAPVVRFAPREAPPDGSEGVEQRTDWLELEVVITVGDRPLGLAQVLEALTLGQERLVLRDGAHVRLDQPAFERLRALVRAARDLEEQPRDGVRVSRHDLDLWAELAEIGLVDAQASTWVRRWVEAARRLRDLDGLPEVSAEGVRADLRSYQAEGFRWLAFLWQSGLGGILADDMGLGKTLQTLALVAHARARGAEPFLVVAPTSVVATWASEAARFAPQLEVREVTESRSRRALSLREVHRGADLVVTSYTLMRLEADEYAALAADGAWGGLVLDEAHAVKNHNGKTHQAVRRLGVPFRLALTGTPMENRLIELWSLLSIVAPGLYPYPQRFKEVVADPVEKEGDAEALARFRRRVRPFLLRRTKELVARDLPPKQEQVLEVRLGPKHRRVYDTHLQRERQHVLGLLGDFDRQRMAIFRSLTRLRQLSLDPALVDPAYDGIGSAKIDVLTDHLLEVTAEGHRALVFSQFTSFLTRVRARLDAEGIASQYLDGRTRRRSEVIGSFKAGEGSVFLISLKAGGTGLTLTEADYVFVLDPWWNPAVEAQAVDRAHRIGQQRPVIVYRLVAADTIEEKVMQLKARKAALFAKVVDAEGGAAVPITADDVRALVEE